jgi:phage-related protein (TIGR01555 family)
MLHLDSVKLMSAFSGLLANRQTGLGTSRSKSEYTEINPFVAPLQREHLTGLYRKSGVIRRAVSLYPQDAKQVGFKLNLTDAKVTPESLEKYVEKLGLKAAITSASRFSRWFGDGYILMGIADGGQPWEEVKRDRIRSIRWLKVFSRWEIHPVRPLSRRWEDLTHYEIRSDLPEDARLWHKSRVLRIPGVELDNDSLSENNGANDSIIQSMFESFCAYYPGLQSTSIMVQDHRLRKLGITGLAETNKDELYDRVVTNDLLRSVARTEIYDKDLEDIDNLTNSYSGLKDVLEILQDAWANDTDISRVILFNQLGKTNLTSGEAFKFSRLDHAYRLNSWQGNHQLEPITEFMELAMLAQDSPTRGELIEGLGVSFPLNYQPTEEEMLIIQKLAAERDEKNIALKLYDGIIARRQYSGAKFDHNITFEEGDEERLLKLAESEQQQPQAQPPTQQPRTDSSIPEEIRRTILSAIVQAQSQGIRLDSKYLKMAQAILDGTVSLDEWYSSLCSQI